MEKRTLLAVALSMVVMIAFFGIQSILNPPQVQSPDQSQESSGQAQGNSPAGQEVSALPSPANGAAGPQSPLAEPAAASAAEIVPLQTVTIETDLIEVKLTNAGGDIVSFRLKQHLDSGEPVEMILTGNAAPRAFAVAFGNREDVMAGRIKPEDRNFRVRRVSNLIVEF